MRLINTQTLELEEFFDILVPRYAILSHTWADGEVSLQDWTDRKNRRFKPGYQKILAACAQAKLDEMDFLWVDTNCIDKTSSAELSEAINSMYKWYARSEVCYAYLSDVPHTDLGACNSEGSAFRKSRWFTRGWTLQELIAPNVLRFFSQDWKELGTKVQMAVAIAETTGIGFWCLVRGKHERPLLRYSVAQRLSWASRRWTTRIEDQAYSLLGLFDISMPLIYGEGHGAFTRLLEEIIRKYADMSFLVSHLRYMEFLPRSPGDFCDSGRAVAGSSRLLTQYYTPAQKISPFHLANTGLQMSMHVVDTLDRNFVFGVLDCWDTESGTDRGRRAISRMWTPLWRNDPYDTTHYTRLTWPSVFIPVRLLPRESLIISTEDSEQDTDGPTAAGVEATSGKVMSKSAQGVKGGGVVDLFTSRPCRDVLIKRPFAMPITPPKWIPNEGGNPFLICFPRGSGAISEDQGRYRLYGIFPPSHKNGKVVDDQAKPLPVIFPERDFDGRISGVRLSEGVSDTGDNSRTGNEHENGGTDGEDAVSPVFRSLIVFVRRMLPLGRPHYLAICLANVPVHQPGQPARYEPRCKVLTGWEPAKRTDLRTLDASSFSTADQTAGALVTIQRVECLGESKVSDRGKQLRSVGLTQVLFDKEELQRNIAALEESQGKNGGVWVWDAVGGSRKKSRA